MREFKFSKKSILIILLTGIVITCLFLIGKDLYENIGSESDVKKVHEIINQNKKDNQEISGITPKDFADLKSENSDFIAYIEFDSGIISLPILQGKDNEYYLHHTFYKKYYYLHGHPFMNYMSKITDDNIIIYGHNNRTSDNKMFSPLNNLLKQEEYEKNAYFKIYFENEIRSYVITHIYKMTAEEYVDYDFERPFILENEWNKWIEFPNRKNLIKPIDGSLEYGNRFVTLQTCAIGNQDILVVLAREIKREKITGWKTLEKVNEY